MSKRYELKLTKTTLPQAETGGREGAFFRTMRSFSNSAFKADALRIHTGRNGMGGIYDV